MAVFLYTGIMSSFLRKLASVTLMGLFLVPVVPMLSALRAEDLTEFRMATLKWHALPGATKYQIQIAVASPENAKTFKAKIDEMSPEPKYVAKLTPGDYEFRIRGLESDGTPGLWSNVIKLKIASRALTGGPNGGPKPLSKDLDVEFEYKD